VRNAASAVAASAASYLKLYGPIRVARSVARCDHCGKSTPVSALLAADVEDVVDGVNTGRFHIAAYIYSVAATALPRQTADELGRCAANYKPILTTESGSPKWANCCTHCGSVLMPANLHYLADGPFVGGPSHFQGELVKLHTDDIKVDADSSCAF
jgi:hypothetical protein